MNTEEIWLWKEVRLRRIGVELVYDLSREDDGRLAEIREHLRSGGRVPFLSAACPAFTSCIEKNLPEWREHISQLPPPAFAAAQDIRSRSARKLGVDPQEIRIISISACTGQKAVTASGVDLAVTTRELVKMLRTACVSMSTSLQVWNALPEEPFDNDDREMPPALMPLPLPEGGVKDVQLDLDGVAVNACIVSGSAHGIQLLRNVADGKVFYDYIEVRACPGGCLAGGGQPRHTHPLQNEICLAAERARGI